MADHRVIIITGCPAVIGAHCARAMKADGWRAFARRNGTGPANRHKHGPEAVYSVLKHALEARRPRPHYLVTTPAKQGAWLKRLLPADFFYRAMRRFD